VPGRITSLDRKFPSWTSPGLYSSSHNTAARSASARAIAAAKWSIMLDLPESPRQRAFAHASRLKRRSLKSERRETLEIDILHRLCGDDPACLKLGFHNRKYNKVVNIRSDIVGRRKL
jgi:hypothetical protein